jgi:hypothetical protein
MPTLDLKAHLKVGLKAMSNSTIEIISAREWRRRWSVEEKLQPMRGFKCPRSADRFWPERTKHPSWYA